MILELQNLVLLIQTIVTSVFLVQALRLLRAEKRPLAVVFFLFFAVSSWINDLYWVIYMLMRPDVRLPFAANEVGEIAVILLIASVLNSVFIKRPVSCAKETLCTVLFTAACIGLWIVWSGEWVQDILGGIPFGYMLCVIVRSLKQADVFSRAKWRLIGAASAALIAVEIAIETAPASLNAPLNLVGYCLMFAAAAFFLAEAGKSFWKHDEADRTLALAAAVLGWSFNAAYMSAGAWYAAAILVETAGFVMFYYAVKREVDEA